MLIETITPVEGFACELLVTIYGKPLQKFYIANEEQYREAIVNMTAFVEKLDIKEIAESAKVDYYNTSAEWHFSRDVGYAENGGYPPTQNGDIRSLFWLFSLMALQN